MSHRPRRQNLHPIVGAALVLISAALVAGTFLSLHRPEEGAPPGFDTPWYVWRANVVTAEGLEGLQAIPSVSRPPEIRPGYPVLAGFLDDVAGAPPFALAFALPAIMATIVGLGAGALAVRCLREPGWTHPLFAVAVGASVHVALTAVGHVDALVVDGLAMAAAATSVIAARAGPAAVATAILLAAAAVVHWVFVSLFLAILLGLAVLQVPRSIRARRDGEAFLGTPSARLVALVAGTALISLGCLALAGSGIVPPQLRPGAPAVKLARHLSAYPLAVTGPLAIVGVALLITARAAVRARSLLLAGLWAATAVAAVVAQVATDADLPAHRILAFALGIPILAAAAVAAGARGLAGRGWMGGIAAAAIVLSAMAGAIVTTRSAWPAPGEGRRDQYAQAWVAGRYVAEVAPGRPVVYPVMLRRWRPNPEVRPHSDVIRAALPADQIPRAFLYVGTVRDLLAERPTVRPGHPRFNALSRQRWEMVRGVLDDAVILALDGFVRGGAVRGEVVGPGVRVVRGPSPPSGRIRGEPPVPSLASLVAITARVLLVLAVVGLGWTGALVPSGWMARVSLAPALGIGMLILIGILAGRLHVDGPLGRVVLTVTAAAIGWAFLIVRSRGRSSFE
ncbi:MAG TPA: hypothetical protein VJ868_01475 [Actinomycetota bacterium]|nr:hypothetical protein [Actinomycetota bacterium]